LDINDARSTIHQDMYLQYLVVFTQVAAGWQPSVTGVNTTRYCKYSQVLLMMGVNIVQNM